MRSAQQVALAMAFLGVGVAACAGGLATAPRTLTRAADEARVAFAAPAPTPTFVDWPTYQYDTTRDGFNPDTRGITPRSLATLHLAWQVGLGNGSQAQPIIIANVANHPALAIVEAYHELIALDALTGANVWRTNLPLQREGTCGTGGLGGTVAYDAALGTLFVSGGNGVAPNHVMLYEVNVADGREIGAVDVTPHLLGGEAVTTHTSVTIASGMVYVDTSSVCEGGLGTPSWRGRIVAVDAASLTVQSTFFTTWEQGGRFGGGGLWGWGGAAADAAGNVYVASGNAETGLALGDATPPPPFERTPDEHVGYAEHIVKLTPGLAVEDSDFPGFNFRIGYTDLDFSGTPVLFRPPLGEGCNELVATQGKGGTLVINDTTQMDPPVATYALSIPSAGAFYIGNPGYSPVTGMLYAPITSSGNGSSMLPPGMAAIAGCGTRMVWHAQFGPDSTAYTEGPRPRSAPTVTAGGVVFMATPCTPDGTGGCGVPGAAAGALWAINAASGTVLGGGKPVLITSDAERMAPSADGLWLWVVDMSGNLYALTVDPSVPAVKQRAGFRYTPTVRYRTN